jgi:tRNA (adenine57-N1/adenine58-N1)-methyltransferase
LSWLSKNKTTEEGDLVELASTKTNYFIFTLKSGDSFQTHRGVIKHDELIGLEWGSEVFSHKGSPFYLLQPGISEIIATTKRNTQIMYPKDIGYILIRLNIQPGSSVIEAGTGSGGLTQILAMAAGKEGHVYTYEAREEMQKLAQKNLERLNLSDRVTYHQQNIETGFNETGVDALFLDLPNPYDYLQQVRQGLKMGGFFGTLLPTVNQIHKLLIELERNDFAFIDVCEILMRFYQADASKFRPVDRMVAHTGYLIFARPVEKEKKDHSPVESDDPSWQN